MIRKCLGAVFLLAAVILTAGCISADTAEGAHLDAHCTPEKNKFNQNTIKFNDKKEINAIKSVDEINQKVVEKQFRDNGFESDGIADSLEDSYSDLVKDSEGKKAGKLGGGS